MSYKISHIDVLTANNGEPLIVGNLTVDGTLSVGGSEVTQYFTYDIANTHFVLTDNTWVQGNVTVDGIFLDSANAEFAYISVDSPERTIDVTLGNGVVGQMFQEVYRPLTKNNTGNTIYNGTVVAFTGVDSGYVTIAPFISDGTYDPSKYWGIATEDIIPGALGFVTFFGKVRGINTSGWAPGTIIYASDSTPGMLTNVMPSTPSDIIVVGVVVVQGIDGTIELNRNINPRAVDIPYSNTDSTLVASNIQSAVDELDARKASIEMLSSGIILYPTSVVGDYGYYRLVSSIDDPDYNDVAYDFSTGSINSTNQYITGLIADANLFVGNPGVISITTLGNIAKTYGNSNSYAEFFFRLYKRDSGGTETLLFTSSTTGEVNGTMDVYQQFSASGLLNDGVFVATDRIVIKYYANSLGTNDPVYKLQFGGQNPTRTLLPIPISVIPSYNADAIVVDTSNFGGIILDGTADDVQTALDLIDNRVAPTESPVLNNPSYTGTLTGSTSTMNLGSGQLYKSANGNVGINSTTPSEKLSVNGNIVITGSLKGPSSFTIDPAAYGNNSGIVIIKGDLQVEGTTTTINSTTLDIVDKNISIAKGASGPTANGAGIFIDGAAVNFFYSYDDDSMNLNKGFIINGVLQTDSPEFGGIPIAPTANTGNISNQIATTAFVEDRSIAAEDMALAFSIALG